MMPKLLAVVPALLWVITAEARKQPPLVAAWRPVAHLPARH